jgi:SAM-dependent methyltransferase
MYRMGVRPWEIDEDPSELVAVAEDPPAASSRALDLGCGTGLQALLLSHHGWDVVGVDFIEDALERAQRRLDESGLAATFVLGDVRRLDELDLGDPYDLVLDSKCFHGLHPSERAAYARSLAPLVAPGGTYLLFALTPNRFRRLLGAPGGVTREQVTSLFEPDFDLEFFGPAPGGLFTPAAYRFRRRS